MGVRSVEYQLTFELWDLYIIFMTMGCIHGKYQQFWGYIFMNCRILGLLLYEICLYGPNSGTFITVNTLVITHFII